MTDFRGTYNSNNEYESSFVFLNSLWFIVITFMSIGYGDVVTANGD